MDYLTLLRQAEDPWGETASAEVGNAIVGGFLSRRAGEGVIVLWMRVDGVPQPVGVAVYRTVQESLTHVVHHDGPGATVTVTVSGGAGGGLAVEIVDDGAGGDGAGPGTGVGLAGMRERVQATGGVLRAGPRPRGGFAVRAVWEGRG